MLDETTISAESAVAGRPFLQALLDVEAAYARARAALDLIPPEHAAAIAAAADAGRYDVATPVVGLVAAMRAEVGEVVAVSVHHGLADQDVADTALMLCAHRALGPLLDDVDAAADAAALLAASHRLTPILGRPLPLPTMFGAMAASWLIALDDAADEVDRVRRTVLAAQVAGAVGDRSTLGEHGTAIATTMAADLGLCHPTLPWHGDRRRPAQLATALALLAGATASVGRDVALLARSDVAEARAGTGEPAGVARAVDLVATVLSATDDPDGRQAESDALRTLIATVGAAVAWLCDLLEHLEVDPARMRANVDAAVAEDVGFAETEIAAGLIVDRALAAHRARRADPDDGDDPT